MPTEREIMGFSSLGPRQTNQPWILSRSVWFHIFIPLFIPPFGQICILVVMGVFLVCETGVEDADGFLFSSPLGFYPF